MFKTGVGKKIEVLRGDMVDLLSRTDNEVRQQGLTIADLGSRLKIVECAATGHSYNKWERSERGWGMSYLPGSSPVYVVGTCECGYELARYPEHMKPTEKKRFIEMGLLSVEDFPVKGK